MLGLYIYKYITYIDTHTHIHMHMYKENNKTNMAKFQLGCSGWYCVNPVEPEPWFPESPSPRDSREELAQTSLQEV